MNLGAESALTGSHRFLRSLPPLCTPTLLMGADNRRVNHGIFLVTLIRQVPKYPLPHTCF